VRKTGTEEIMKPWQEKHYNALQELSSPSDIFAFVETEAQTLGFEYVAFGLEMKTHMRQSKIIRINNYPAAWQQRYDEAGYLDVDPVVQHARRSETPLVWGAQTPREPSDFWADAFDHGVRSGWAQSSLPGHGSLSLLKFCRGKGRLSETELNVQELRMRCLVQLTHVAMTRSLMEQETAQIPKLTQRELEVLQWTAEGKSAQTIADILGLSKSAVDFHIKNLNKKLQVTNKIAAVSRALLLRILK